MYLKNIAIKHIGPIEELSVELPFKENGDPKPIIFVGENGTGKTMLESQVIDAFYEIAGATFNNVRTLEGVGYKYYKVSGGGQLRQGAEKGFSLLKFESKSCGKIEYYDKINNVTKQDFIEYIKDFDMSPDGQIGNYKDITNIPKDKKDAFNTEWNSGAYFYQPAHRFEEPFWKNDPFKKDDAINADINFTDNLKKEIEIISSSSKTKSFLLDLVLDFARDVHANSATTLQNISRKVNNSEVVTPADTIVRPVLDQLIWSNINEILKKIRRKEKMRFGIGQRGGTRISIVSLDTNNEVVGMDLQSIDYLSLGESVLLNLFVNIIRHASNKLLGDIEGIVVIDEIDVHLHTSLQNETLPELIKMFPKVQFIITTHSPLFLLGMNKTFGDDGFEIRNMPTGERITTERFSEFEHAFNVLKETEKFENELKNAVVSKSKPVVYVEGPTDVEYIKQAYKLYGKGCEAFDIEIIGEETKDGTKDSNKVALKNAEAVLRTNLKLLHQKVILLNDPEESIDEKESENLLYIRKMPYFPQNPLQKGIENLFMKALIDNAKKANSQSFEHHVVGIQEKNHKILNGEKHKICTWICRNGVKDDFKNFKKIFEIIQNILEPASKSS